MNIFYTFLKKKAPLPFRLCTIKLQIFIKDPFFQFDTFIFVSYIYYDIKGTDNTDVKSKCTKSCFGWLPLCDKDRKGDNSNKVEVETRLRKNLNVTETEEWGQC